MQRFRISCSRVEVLVGVAVLLLGAASAAMANDPDELAEARGAVIVPGPGSLPEAFPVLSDVLFMGTSTNTNNPAGTVNDIFVVDPVTSTATSGATGVGVWGATSDQAGQRVLFTRASGLTPPAGQIGGGDELMAVPFGGGDPVSLGRITIGGEGFRIDGLAISGGVLYGVNAGGGTQNGFYSIDWSTLVATQIAVYSDSISGIDADPSTGIIYGVNDSTGQLVTISTSGVISALAAYPAGETDIDGIGVGGGKAYLVTDEPGSVAVYDIASGTYDPPLTSPFTSSDTFSGAAFVEQPAQPTPTPGPPGQAPIPTMSSFGLVLLIGLIAVAALLLIGRR